jgi:hypothetical protein
MACIPSASSCVLLMGRHVPARIATHAVLVLPMLHSCITKYSNRCRCMHAHPVHGNHPHMVQLRSFVMTSMNDHGCPPPSRHPPPCQTCCGPGYACQPHHPLGPAQQRAALSTHDLRAGDQAAAGCQMLPLVPMWQGMQQVMCAGLVATATARPRQALLRMPAHACRPVCMCLT